MTTPFVEELKKQLTGRGRGLGPSRRFMADVFSESRERVMAEKIGPTTITRETSPTMPSRSPTRSPLDGDDDDDDVQSVSPLPFFEFSIDRAHTSFSRPASVRFGRRLTHRRREKKIWKCLFLFVFLFRRWLWTETAPFSDDGLTWRGPRKRNIRQLAANSRAKKKEHPTNARNYKISRPQEAGLGPIDLGSSDKVGGGPPSNGVLAPFHWEPESTALTTRRIKAGASLKKLAGRVFDPTVSGPRPPITTVVPCRISRRSIGKEKPTKHMSKTNRRRVRPFSFRSSSFLLVFFSCFADPTDSAYFGQRWACWCPPPKKKQIKQKKEYNC